MEMHILGSHYSTIQGRYLSASSLGRGRDGVLIERRTGVKTTSDPTDSLEKKKIFFFFSFIFFSSLYLCFILELFARSDRGKTNPR